MGVQKLDDTNDLFFLNREDDELTREGDEHYSSFW